MSRLRIRFVVLLVLVVGVLTAVFSAAAETPLPAQPELRGQLPYLPTAPNGVEGIATTESPQVTLSSTKIVFQAVRGNNWELHYEDDDGDNMIRVTSNDVQDIHPRLNPGATLIAFASNEGGDYEIYFIHPASHYTSQLTDNNHDDTWPVWSPDGSRIAFQSERDGQSEIYVMNSDGTNQIRLTTSSAFDGFPTWSPDGTRLAFSSNRSGGYRIYMMDANGANVTQLSTQPYSAYPTWSPDGARIAYSADNDGDGWFDVWTMNADGTSQALRSAGGNLYDHLAYGWSPDGKYVTYTSVRYINYNGNWYWTRAWLEAKGIPGMNISLGQYENISWNPDWRSLDPSPPTSKIDPLPPMSAYASIPLSWQASDVGSGLDRFEIQVKVNDDNWYTFDWLSGDTFATVFYDEGTVPGNSYCFRSVAYDQSNNVEYVSDLPDACTLIDNLPPVTHLDSLPPYSRDDEMVNLTWEGYDQGVAGIYEYEMQVRNNDSNWYNYYLPQGVTSYDYSPDSAGNTVYFRLRARDYSGNYEEWSQAADGDTQTTFYHWGIQGAIQDNTGVPIAAATAQFMPMTFIAEPSDGDGRYLSLTAAETPTYTVAWAKNTYGDLPPTVFTYGPDMEFKVIMPPADDLIINGNFESAQLDPGWLVSGNPVPSVVPDAYTGQYAVQLGTEPSKTTLTENDAWLTQVITLPHAMPNPVLSFLYQLGNVTQASGSALSVAVNDGVQTTTIQTITTETDTWTHTWADLTPWQGQTISLTLHLHSTSTAVWGLVDEVTAGSSHPDLWLTLTQSGQSEALPGDSLTYSLIYGNRGYVTATNSLLTYTLPVGMAYAQSSVPPVSTLPLVWDLGSIPADTSGSIIVTTTITSNAPLLSTITTTAEVNTAQEIETHNNQATSTVFIGRHVYLPVIVHK